MIITKLRTISGNMTNFDNNIDRVEIEVGEYRYTITEDHDSFIRIRKSDDSLLLKPGCSNEILIK